MVTGFLEETHDDLQSSATRQRFDLFDCQDLAANCHAAANEELSMALTDLVIECAFTLLLM